MRKGEREKRAERARQAADETRRREERARRRALRPALIDSNQFYSVDEAAAASDMSRMQLYRDIKRGVLNVVKDGKRTKILGAEIIRANQAKAQAAEPRAQ